MPTKHAHMLHSGSDDSLDVVGGGGHRSDFSTVGLMLRETRERYGLTLRDVANALRIRVVYLHALEEGRFADLPGRPYVTGFLRSYAEYFSLDGDEVVSRFREERADAGRPAKLVFPEPPPETRFPIGAMLALLVVVSIVGYGGWQLLGVDSSDVRPQVAAVPEDLAAESDRIESEIAEYGGDAAGGPVLADAADIMPPVVTTRSMAPAPAPVADPDTAKALEADDLTVAAADPAVPAPESTAEVSGPMIDFSSASAASMPPGRPGAVGAAEGAATGVAAQPISPSLLGFPNAGETSVPSDLAALGPLGEAGPATVPASISAIEAEATTVYGEVNADARVILRATADCWIEITDDGGSEVFTRLLRAGEIYKVPNRADLRLRMGNAGGMEVIVDGTVMPPLGAHGEVMRNVSLDPAALSAPL